MSNHCDCCGDNFYDYPFECEREDCACGGEGTYCSEQCHDNHIE